MASNAKRKTTMAKLNREQRLRERRIEKAARKEARKLAPPEPELLASDALYPLDGESLPVDAESLDGDTQRAGEGADAPSRT